MGNCEKIDTDEVVEVTRAVQNGPTSRLEIVCVAWLKNYSNLFDFESKEVTRTRVMVDFNGFLLKNKDRSFALCDYEHAARKKGQSQALLEVRRMEKEGHFLVSPGVH
jgi:hypothetical protein